MGQKRKREWELGDIRIGGALQPAITKVSVFRYSEYNENLDQGDIFIILDFVGNAIDKIKKQFDYTFISDVSLKKNELVVEVFISFNVSIQVNKSLHEIFHEYLYSSLVEYSNDGIILDFNKIDLIEKSTENDIHTYVSPNCQRCISSNFLIGDECDTKLQNIRGVDNQKIVIREQRNKFLFSN